MENNQKYIGIFGGGEKEVKKMDMEICKLLYGEKWKEKFNELYPSKEKELKAV